MGVHMVHAPLRIVLEDDHRHLLPVGGMRQELQEPPQRQVVVGHEALPVGIAIVFPGIRHVVVGDLDGDEPGEGLLAAEVLVGHLLLELVHAQLVGNVEVEPGIVVGRPRPFRPGHGVDHRHAQACVRVRRILVDPGELVALAVAAERDAVPVQLLPQAADLVVVLGVDAPGAVREPAARRRGKGIPVLGHRRVGFHPGIGHHAHHPPVPVHRGVGVAEEVVGQGPAAGDLLVVRGDHDLTQHGAVQGPQVHPAEAGDGGVAVDPGKAPEHVVEGAVLLGHVDDVLDRAVPQADRRGHRALRIVGHRHLAEGVRLHPPGHVRQLPVIRRRNRLQQTQLNIAHIGPLGRLAEARPAIGAGAIAPGRGDIEGLAILRYHHPGRAPTGGDIAQHPAAAGVDHGDGIERQGGHIEPPTVRAEGHVKGRQAPLAVQAGIEGQADMVDDVVVPPVDHGDRVIGGVGDIGEPGADDDAAGARPAHRGQALDHLPDLEARLQLCRHGLGGQVHGIDAHGFRCIRGAEPRQAPAVRQGHALLRFAGGNRVGREMQHLRVTAFRGDTGDEGIFEQTDIAHIGGPPVRAQPQRQGQPTDLDRADHPTGRPIQGHQPVIGPVEDIKLCPVRAQRHVTGQAVLVGHAAEGTVQLVLADADQPLGVHQGHRPGLVLGEVNGTAVGGEDRPHEAAALDHGRPGLVIAGQADGMGEVVQPDHRDHLVVQQYGGLAIRRQGEAIGLVRDQGGLAGGRDQPAAGQDAGPAGREAGRLRCRRGEQVGQGGRGGAAGETEAERCQEPDDHRPPHLPCWLV